MKRYTKGFFGADAEDISDKINKHAEEENALIIQAQFILSKLRYECLVIFEKE